MILTHRNQPIYDGQPIVGSSMTIPNLAPTLVELIEASISNGEPLPVCGSPLYDEDDASGIARVQANAATFAEQYDLANEAAANPLNAVTTENTSTKGTPSVTEENSPTDVVNGGSSE